MGELRSTAGLSHPGGAGWRSARCDHDHAHAGMPQPVLGARASHFHRTPSTRWRMPRRSWS